MRLLSVDWDFFCPTEHGSPLYDWDSREGHPLEALLWTVRASAFFRVDRPLPTASGSEVGFWDRFRLRPGALAFVAESHSWIYKPQIYKAVDQVVNYDAHHDAGYGVTLKDIIKRGTITCEDWAVGYSACRGIPVQVRYPAWKTWAFEHEHSTAVPLIREFDDGRPDPEPFGRVFICRSGAWSPPWLDQEFEKLLAAFPGSVIRLHPLPPREFNADEARKMAQAERRLAAAAEIALGTVSGDGPDTERFAATVREVLARSIQNQADRKAVAS